MAAGLFLRGALVIRRTPSASFLCVSRLNTGERADLMIGD
jgi:hypothetical protein